MLVYYFHKLLTKKFVNGLIAIICVKDGIFKFQKVWSLRMNQLENTD